MPTVEEQILKYVSLWWLSLIINTTPLLFSPPLGLLKCGHALLHGILMTLNTILFHLLFLFFFVLYISKDLPSKHVFFNA